jgi:dolichol kinase
MPTNKHKRKASAHSKPKIAKPPGLITSHPKAFGLVGLFLVAVSAYLLFFESQDNAMFGLAMLSLVTGIALTIFAKITVTKKN